MRFALATILALLSACAYAQASIPITGSVNGANERAQLVSVNFGGTAQSVQLDLAIQATSGTSGLAAFIFDLEELAANGSANAVAGDFDSGTAVMNISLTTGSYSGVVDFLVGVETDSGTGTSPFNGTLSCATLSSGSINAGPVQIVPPPISTNINIHDRILTGNRDASSQVVFEFDVDFGSSPQLITYYLQGSGTVGGTIEVAELSGAGTPLTMATVTDPSGFVEETNSNTTIRSGTVTFRITITPAASGTFDWTIGFPDSVAIQSLGGGGGGGGGDDEGCSTGESSGLSLLALLALLAAAWLLQKRIPPKHQNAKARQTFGDLAFWRPALEFKS